MMSVDAEAIIRALEAWRDRMARAANDQLFPDKLLGREVTCADYAVRIAKGAAERERRPRAPASGGEGERD